MGSEECIRERGGAPGGAVAGDSDLLVEAIADDGTTVLASYKILRANYTKADYKIRPIVHHGLNHRLVPYTHLNLPTNLRWFVWVGRLRFRPQQDNSIEV